MLGFIISVIGFITIVLFSIYFGKTIKRETRNPKEKRDDILNKYKLKLDKKLANLDGQNRQKEKLHQLKLIAKELELNIYFDKEESKKAIEKLAKEC